MKYIKLKFSSLKEFDIWQRDIRGCVKEAGYCPGMLDHYYYNDKGKKIKRGRNELILITIEKGDKK